MDEAYDVVIIGGGPAGTSAAIYTARAELRTLVVERPGKSGSLAYSEHIANYPGAPGTLKGSELLGRMEEQARSFGAEYREELVNAITLESDPKHIYTSEGGAYQGRAVIIATGALERKTKIAGEEEFLGRGVSTCATCDAPFYSGKTVVVAGNDNYAAEEAIAIARYATRLYVAVPTAKPMIAPALLEELGQLPHVEVRTGWRLREIQGDEQVRRVRFATANAEETLETDGVFVYLGGAKPTTEFLAGQVGLDAEGAIVTGENFVTSVPRVYAIGDVRAGHLRQVVVAAAEGCMAALAVERDLRGRDRIVPDYR